MKPEKITNAELADWLSSEIDMMATARNRYNGNLNEAAKRLRAMPEPTEPEFCVGWRGGDTSGNRVEIFAEREKWIFGIVSNVNDDGDCWPEMWYRSGEGLTSAEGEVADLVPNTPEPEIWWRRKGLAPGELFASARDVKISYPNAETEKVEVRVIK